MAVNKRWHLKQQEETAVGELEAINLTEEPAGVLFPVTIDGLEELLMCHKSRTCVGREGHNRLGSAMNHGLHWRI